MLRPPFSFVVFLCFKFEVTRLSLCFRFSCSAVVKYWSQMPTPSLWTESAFPAPLPSPDRQVSSVHSLTAINLTQNKLKFSFHVLLLALGKQFKEMTKVLVGIPNFRNKYLLLINMCLNFYAERKVFTLSCVTFWPALCLLFHFCMCLFHLLKIFVYKSAIQGLFDMTMAKLTFSGIWG